MHHSQCLPHDDRDQKAQPVSLFKNTILGAGKKAHQMKVLTAESGDLRTRMERKNQILQAFL